jgi:acyl-CoA synthetase (NDP forming)
MTDDRGLDNLLRPKRMALVGATSAARDNPWKGGARLTRRLARLTDVDVHFVNPGRSEILGRPSSRTLTDIGEHIDLAVLSVPAGRLAPVLEDVERADIGACVVHTAHVSAADKAAIRAIRERNGTRFIGPNSAGIMLAAGRIDSMPGATGVEPLFGADGVAVVSQSGGFCTESVLLLRELGIPVREVVSTGDEVDLTAEDVAAELLSADTLPRALLLFMESARQPAELGTVLRTAGALGIPVGIVKVGRSAASAAAALSHTGALVGEWDVFAAAIARDGAIMCDTVDDLISVAVMAYSGMPARTLGRSVALATNSGGLGGLSADHLSAGRLTLPVFDRSTLARLAELGGDHSSWNPVDFADVPTLTLPDYVLTVADDPSVDQVVVEVRGGIPYSSDAEELRVLADVVAKPVLACWPGLEPAQRATLIAAGVPAFASARQLWRSLDAFAEWQDRRTGDLPHVPRPTGDSATAVPVSYRTARELAAEAGLPQPRYVVVGPDTTGEIIGVALTAPVAAKLSVATVVHKADAGGVRLGIGTDDEIWQFVRDLRNAHGADAEITVEEMIEAGVEVLVSARRTEYGVLLAIGWGGSLTEIVADVVELMLPASDDQILAAARTTKVWRALARSVPIDDAEPEVLAIVHAVLKCLATDVAVVEVNPVIVNRHGASAADVRMLATTQKEASR